jgi:hypothetical protein
MSNMCRMEKSTLLKDQLAEKLLSIAPNITTKDRRDAAEKFRLSGRTIYRYITGVVNSVDTGMMLYDYFVEKIREKEVLLRS